MPLVPWRTQEIGDAPCVAAPDGSVVRILCATSRGSMIGFSLEAGAVSRAVAHRTVEEIWFVIAGRGRLWRGHGEDGEIAELGAGLSLTIPVGSGFQFRNDGDDTLRIVAVTMPPWPGADEAYTLEGPWRPTV